MLRSQEELSAYFQNNDYLDGIEELADIQTEDELLYEINIDQNIIDNKGSESVMSFEYDEKSSDESEVLFIEPTKKKLLQGNLNSYFIKK